jgi:hypothetical protein
LSHGLCKGLLEDSNDRIEGIERATDFRSFLTRSISAGSFAAKVSLSVCAPKISKDSSSLPREADSTFAIAESVINLEKNKIEEMNGIM